MDQSEIPQARLAEIINRSMHAGDGIATVCRRVAHQLSVITSPNPHWGWSYIHQVWHGKLSPSGRLVIAINRLYQDECDNGIFETVAVLAPVGYVAHNAIVCVPTRICMNPVCSRAFLPANPMQKFCCKTCRAYSKKVVNGSEKNNKILV